MSDEIITFQALDPEELSALLSSYTVTALIAQGGMGAVYHAVQDSLDRSVAIKLLPKEFGDEEFKEQFAAEAKAMAKLNHPNLIGIYDFGEVEDMPYIVMEYVEGKSLYYSCYEKAVEQSESIRLITEICEGLAHAHEHGIIHRDIKPANILLDRGAHAKIGDFGLASQEQTGDEEFVYGTPGYAAPEVTQDPSTIGIPSDVFAVGVILHQLLTGKLPDEDARPASRQAQCHPQLDRIIRKATHANPASRYLTATEMVADLKAVPALRGLVTSQASPVRVEQAAPKQLTIPPSAKQESVANTVNPAPESHSPPPAPVAVQPETNWPFIRNLMIIALLIPALIFAWGKYHEVQESRAEEAETSRIARQQSEALQRAQEEKARKMAQDRKRREEAERKRREDEKANITNLVRGEKKPPLEQLASLKGELRGGSRAAFPQGTFKRGTNHFFLITEPMSWSGAAQFAEDHGGHVATPIGRGDLLWLANQQSEARRIWIGGGAVGDSEWGWVTGEAWQHKKPTTAIGTCAAITRTGVINARPNGEKMPFFIQWSADGENKGSLEAQLERLRGTLNSPSPAWPPGTVTTGGRAYLLVQRALAWDEAEMIASSNGGHLAVYSDEFEKEYLRQLLSDNLGDGEAAWLGARKIKNTWTWTTREGWILPDWGPNAPTNDEAATALSFLVSVGGSGFHDMHPDDTAQVTSFLIEWSEDYQKAPKKSAKIPDGEMNHEIKKLRIASARIIGRYLKEHRIRLKNNQQDLLFRINGWHRNLPGSAIARYQPTVEAIRGSIDLDTGKVPTDMNTSNLPEELGDLLEGAKATQLRFEKTLGTEIAHLRRSYLARLLKGRKEAEDAGFKSQIPAFDQEIKAIGQDVTSFRSHFGMEE